MKKSILVLEDSKEYQLLIKHSLESKYDVTLAGDMSEAMKSLFRKDFDVFLLDIVLPVGSGFEFSSFLRSQEKYKNKTIIFLTGSGDIDSKLKGFEAGGNDFVVKPFDSRELLARINAHLLRHIDEPKRNIQFHEFNIDLDKQLVFDKDNQTVELTRIEFKLLILFVTHIEHVLTRQQILDAVWPENLNVSERTVDTHISNLRKKIGPLSDALVSVHGAGYRFKNVG
jgi:DNA-binding response OmpR family regulator